mmetsp:Transcript_7203/g.23771  ORF Transcript_7203/g.23771 Transcript_7203/m.23771 type:complete len:207 (+) Transcript_7203:292-912(+)
MLLGLLRHARRGGTGREGGRLGRLGLGLEVGELVRDGGLDLVDLGGGLVDRLRDLELVVDLGGDAVVLVEVGSGGGGGVERGLRLGHEVVLLVELQRFGVGLGRDGARRLADLAEFVRQSRTVGESDGEQHARRELVEEVDADDAAGGRSADDNRLPLRLRHHRRGRDARHREPRLHRRCRQRRDERRRGGEKAEEQHEASHVDLS